MSDKPSQRLFPLLLGMVLNLVITMTVVLAICAIPYDLQLWHVALAITASYFTAFITAFSMGRVKWFRQAVNRMVAFFSPPVELPKSAELSAELEQLEAELDAAELDAANRPELLLVCPVHGPQQTVQACVACLRTHSEVPEHDQEP